MRLGEGVTALVTGASRGLGVEIARALAAQGCDLLLAARSQDELDAVAKAIRDDFGREVAVLVADLVSAGAVEALADAAGRAAAVDVLVNNAGIESTYPFDQRDAAEIEQTVGVNLVAPMLLTRALLPDMLARGRGHIVNVASVAGILPTPFNEPYCATKFGLVGFTRALRQTARACRWPVSASAVCPGFISGAGLFEDLVLQHGLSADDLEPSPIADVGPAVIAAIEQDLPDVMVSGGDPRAVAAFALTDPVAFEAVAELAPTTRFFRDIAAARGARL